MTQTLQLPRELVLASAGTGKTFRISSRIIGLLAAGSAPEAIFASTFTRKAAGEILDRVLVRLAEAALDQEAARELAEHASLPVDDTPAHREPKFWLGLLERLVRDLHRLNVSTLDSFFVRAVTHFADEVALPPGWRIADDLASARVREEALQEVLAHAGRGAVLELVRGIAGDAVQRSVHAGVLEEAVGLLDLHHGLDPDRGDGWSGFDGVAAECPSDLDERLHALAEAMEAAEVPRTKKGTPDQRWSKGLRGAAEALRAGDWGSLLSSSLCANSREEDGTYYGTEIPEEIRSLFLEACALARHTLAGRLARQCRTMGRLAALYADAVQRKQNEIGAFGFSDLTRLMGGPDALCERPDLYYRLDARTRHILLDEFQDTSLPQWEALMPLVDELLSGYVDERGTVIVADPKQSIYAWRGGEPLLVRRVGAHYGLDHDVLDRSWRSSQVVLDVVNRVFEGVAENPVLEKDEIAQRTAADWREAYSEHRAAKELPGCVQLHVGPEDEGRGEDRPRLCHRAAELAAELHARSPGRSIGILTRRNATVARIMLELRAMGVTASEEGGNPLVDSGAVASVLALLRLADHPGDRVSRYHVARTPVGEAVRYTEWEDGDGARRLAHRFRRRLLEDGYGRTLAALVRDLEPACDARERRRLGQLVELAYRYDARVTLRVGDFVRLVELERVEDPVPASIRVMTIHQSKGLEFDTVILPELDAPLTRGRPRPLAYRPEPTGRIARVFPYVAKDVRALFPELHELHAAADQAHAAELRDALSGLYVALTRARHAMHILVKPDGDRGMGSGLTGANLVRHALSADGPAAEGDVLYTHGDPAWDEPRERDRGTLSGITIARGPDTGETVALRGTTERRRALPRVHPSELAGGRKVDLRRVLRLDGSAAERGTLVHAWLERVEWLEDGLPGDDELRAIARTRAPAISAEQVDDLIASFRRWLDQPEVARVLSRSSYPEGATVEREVLFLHRVDGTLVEGVIDRLVLVREGGRVTRAEVLDFKTDALERGDTARLRALTQYYMPQLEAYRDGVVHGWRLTREAVECGLVLLCAGAVEYRR